MREQRKIRLCMKAVDSGNAVDFMRYHVTIKADWLRDYIAREGTNGILVFEYRQELRTLWRMYRSAQWDARAAKKRQQDRERVVA